MHSRTLPFFKGFLLSEPAAEQKELRRYLTPSLHSLEKDSHAFPLTRDQDFPLIEEKLSSIHPSWLLPLIERFPRPDQGYFLSVLPLQTRMALEKGLNLSAKTPSPLARPFLLVKIWDALVGTEQLIPESFLPQTPLSPLLKLSFKELIAAVDLLSVHDFLAERHLLINGRNLKQILHSFSSKQNRYLKKIALKKEPISFAFLHLNLWDGDEEKLKAALHHRGLNRLAKALFGLDPSFIWILLHRFDTGRASVISAHLKDMHNKAAHDILRNQVTELLEYIKT